MDGIEVDPMNVVRDCMVQLPLKTNTFAGEVFRPKVVKIL
jgi:hypothetical protein